MELGQRSRSRGLSAGVGSVGSEKAPCRAAGWRAGGAGHGAAFPLLLPALPAPPSVRPEAGAGGRSARAGNAAPGRGTGRARGAAARSIFCLPVTETLRWQSGARRSWEGGGVCPSSARPPSIVGGGTGTGTCSGRRRPGCSCPSWRSGDAAAVPGPQLAAGGRRCCLCLPGPASASGNEHESARPRLLLHAQLLCKCCFLFPFSPPWKRGRKPAALSNSHAAGGILWIGPGRRGTPFLGSHMLPEDGVARPCCPAGPKGTAVSG